MRRTLHAVCVKCNHRFDVGQENGKSFHLLHCVRCGRVKKIEARDIRSYCTHYIHTLQKSDPGNSRTNVETVQPLIPGKP